MARVASGRAFDIENVDPATGLLSTLRNSTNGAPQLKKASATVDARAPFSELTGLFQVRTALKGCVTIINPRKLTWGCRVNYARWHRVKARRRPLRRLRLSSR